MQTFSCPILPTPRGHTGQGVICMITLVGLFRMTKSLFSHKAAMACGAVTFVQQTHTFGQVGGGLSNQLECDADGPT